MKLAVCSATLPELDADTLLDWLASQGAHALELGVGGYPGTRHASAHDLSTQAQLRRWWQAQCAQRNLQLAALACHGNPLHPQAELAQTFHSDFMAALEAANALEVPVVVGFSGQPGTGAIPNWPVIAWPDEYTRLHEQQWQEHVLPYWQAVARRAQELGVTIAIEMHGGFAVHNPAGLMRLREACGPALAANLDPSHLWWQGMDPLAVIRLLGPAIVHMHLKDTVFNTQALNLHGLLDLTPHHQVGQRAWHFDIPGRGHDAPCWQTMLQALLDQGYGGVFSVEHEAPCPAQEGIADCLHFMRSLSLSLPAASSTAA